MSFSLTNRNFDLSPHISTYHYNRKADFFQGRSCGVCFGKSRFRGAGGRASPYSLLTASAVNGKTVFARCFPVAVRVQSKTRSGDARLASVSTEPLPQKRRPRRRLFGGSGWIRTTEGVASRFTVCPLWPLGNAPIFGCAVRRRCRRTSLELVNGVEPSTC